jgi:uncharacterized membrane protein
LLPNEGLLVAERNFVVFTAAVVTFFIAGLLFICALSTSITWERTASRRRPAFSLENNFGEAVG